MDEIRARRLTLRICGVENLISKKKSSEKVKYFSVRSFQQNEVYISSSGQ